jgi:hypothetical protein
METSVATWLLTYVLHSSLLIGGAWLLSRVLPSRAHLIREALWKTALVGGVITASIQMASHLEPAWGSFKLPLSSAGGRIAEAGFAPTINEDLAAPPFAGSDPGEEPTRGLSPSSPILAMASNATVDGSADGSTIGSVDEPPKGALDVNEGSAPSRASGIEWVDAGAGGPATPTDSRRALPGELPAVLVGLSLAASAFGLTRFARLNRRLKSQLGRRDELVSGSLHHTLDRLCASAGVRRRVRLTDSTNISSPIALGGSEICVPSRAMLDLPRDEQRVMLAHELGHIVRRDPMWLKLCGWIESLFPFQPLNRLARRNIQREAEYLCDDWAVEQTGLGLSLARCLAQVASWLETGHGNISPTMAANGSPLVTRVQRLLDGKSGRSPRVLRWLRFPAILLPLAGVILAGPRVVAMESPRVGSATDHVETPLLAMVEPPTLPPDPASAIDLPWDRDDFTLETKQDGRELRVRVEDGEVTSVRVNDEPVPEDRYDVESGLLTVRDESGDVIFEVDIDLGDLWRERLLARSARLADERFLRGAHLRAIREYEKARREASRLSRQTAPRVTDEEPAAVRREIIRERERALDRLRDTYREYQEQMRRNLAPRAAQREQLEKELQTRMEELSARIRELRSLQERLPSRELEESRQRQESLQRELRRLRERIEALPGAIEEPPRAPESPRVPESGSSVPAPGGEPCLPGHAEVLATPAPPAAPPTPAAPSALPVPPELAASPRVSVPSESPAPPALPAPPGSPAPPASWESSPTPEAPEAPETQTPRILDWAPLDEFDPPSQQPPEMPSSVPGRRYVPRPANPPAPADAEALRDALPELPDADELKGELPDIDELQFEIQELEALLDQIEHFSRQYQALPE